MATHDKPKDVFSSTENDGIEEKLERLKSILHVLDVKGQTKVAKPDNSPTSKSKPVGASAAPAKETGVAPTSRQSDVQDAKKQSTSQTKAGTQNAKKQSDVQDAKKQSTSQTKAGTQNAKKQSDVPKSADNTDKATGSTQAKDNDTQLKTKKPTTARRMSAKKITPKEIVTTIKIISKKSIQKTSDIDEATKPQNAEKPKKIPVKKPAPKKTATKPAAKKKKVSLIKSAKTPKKRKASSNIPNTLEDELAITLTPEEIDGFQIEKVDMEKLTHKVCDILLRYESEGMVQADLYKKLKLNARDGARLSLKLERMGMVNRVKILVGERWTYKITLKKTPVSTTSLENAPCLVCPVEQRCSLDGDISPRTCTLIEEWVMADLKLRS